MKTAIQLVERGLVPGLVLRRGIRSLLKQRVEEETERQAGGRDAALAKWAEEMRKSPVALVPELANAQHYEVPAAFFEEVLGPHRKYSSAYYETSSTTLAEAEAAMLALTCERAGLRDGQSVLELGCGWGSLSLWMARHYPAARILSVSNSASQRASIMQRARAAGLDNLEVVTRDMNDFETDRKFDRVVSVEMFEHMRNWEALLARVAGWLNPDGRLFLHVFAHQRFAYSFEVRDATDWMSQYFFSGGMMPSHDLLDHMDTPFEVEQRWVVSGEHYARTSEDWLTNLEQRRERVMPILAETYGAENARQWFHRWRVFFLACAELFAWEDGSQWIVSHQLLKPRRSNA
ncbi:MAG: class I SAM-dependent methyltransferase [Planctomycetes bacterium]|nr:class I SAM-dependent methyltransferase [Planctomycetota bacterium]MCB9903917.1 class I SAM-dependent methyltransferase [Planctomycetota bacterium]